MIVPVLFFRWVHITKQAYAKKNHRLSILGMAFQSRPQGIIAIKWAGTPCSNLAMENPQFRSVDDVSKCVPNMVIFQ